VSRLKRLIQEIHRRSLWQVLGIYLGGAWVALQGIEALVSVLGLPEWVPGFAVVLLIAGLPIVLANLLSAPVSSSLAWERAQTGRRNGDNIP
jgi:hypothetical protein